ncbi:unnamed protein product [Colias eurytheme]|nr:unnamed protein product [Colias eurytheme]
MCLPVANCCFCISLSVGAKIVAVLSLIASAGISLVYSTAAMLPKLDNDVRRISYCVIALAAAIKFIMACVMTFGTFLKKPKLLYPWLLTAWLYSVLLIVLSLCGTILMALQYSKDLQTSAEVNTMVSVYFIYAIILYYFASVVNSRREEMIRDFYTYRGHHLIGHRVLPKMYP